MDVVDTHPERAAEKALITHSRLKAALFGAGHNPSAKKTFVLASTKEGASSLNQKRSPGEGPEVRRVGLDLGMATTRAGRRSSLGFRNRMGKATRRNSKRIKLRLPSVKANVRILQGSVLAGGIWGHQAQGLSPKERKTVRVMAAATGFRQKLGSVDIVLDLGEGGLKDPHETVVLQHWRAMGKSSVPRSLRTGWSAPGRFFGAALRGHTAGKECRGPWGLLSVTSRNLAFKGNNWMLGFSPKCPPDPFSQGIEAFLSLLTLGTLRKRLASRKPSPGPSELPDGAALLGRTRVPTSRRALTGRFPGA